MNACDVGLRKLSANLRQPRLCLISILVDANQILVIDGRRIVERGTHRELLAKQGVYAQMWALQQQEEE